MSRTRKSPENTPIDRVSSEIIPPDRVAYSAKSCTETRPIEHVSQNTVNGFVNARVISVAKPRPNPERSNSQLPRVGRRKRLRRMGQISPAVRRDADIGDRWGENGHSLASSFGAAPVHAGLSSTGLQSENGQVEPIARDKSGAFGKGQRSRGPAVGSRIRRSKSSRAAGFCGL